jgi:hypothetical protein
LPSQPVTLSNGKERKRYLFSDDSLDYYRIMRYSETYAHVLRVMMVIETFKYTQYFERKLTFEVKLGRNAVQYT